MAYTYAFGDATGGLRDLGIHKRTNVVAAARNVDVMIRYKFLYVYDHDDRLVEVLNFSEAYEWWWTRPNVVRNTRRKFGVPKSILQYQLKVCDRWYRRKYELA